MISRKDFLKGLLAIPFIGGLAAKRALAGEKKYLLNKFSVAGFQFYEGPDMIETMKGGQMLELEAEPKNPHDYYAVKIIYNKKHIGYVPRSDNRAISRMLRQGLRLQGEIMEVHPQEDPWQMLRVKVWLVG